MNLMCRFDLRCKRCKSENEKGERGEGGIGGIERGGVLDFICQICCNVLPDAME